MGRSRTDRLRGSRNRRRVSSEEFRIGDLRAAVRPRRQHQGRIPFRRRRLLSDRESAPRQEQSKYPRRRRLHVKGHRGALRLRSGTHAPVRLFSAAMLLAVTGYEADRPPLSVLLDVRPGLLPTIQGSIEPNRHGRVRQPSGPARHADYSPARPRATRHSPRPRRARRQDRAEPPHERHAGGDGAGTIPVVVRRFRPGAGEDGRPGHRPAEGRRRPVPRPSGGFGTGADPGWLEYRATRRRRVLESGILERPKRSRRGCLRRPRQHQVGPYRNRRGPSLEHRSESGAPRPASGRHDRRRRPAGKRIVRADRRQGIDGQHRIRGPAAQDLEHAGDRLVRGDLPRQRRSSGAPRRRRRLSGSPPAHGRGGAHRPVRRFRETSVFVADGRMVRPNGEQQASSQKTRGVARRVACAARFRRIVEV